MDIGSSGIARRFFRHDPPTSLELESAIDAVEDEVMRVRSPFVDGATLVSADPALAELASAADSTTRDDGVLTLDSVELLFQRLASASLGHPRAMDGMPAGPEGAARLLVLRELMHHLGYASIAVVERDALQALVPPATRA
jgi:exopolyphosphatase/pppGpp-phosphohydrolase